MVLQIHFNGSSNVSELAGVKEHDLEVTDQARAAEENVSMFLVLKCRCSG